MTRGSWPTGWPAGQAELLELLDQERGSSERLAAALGRLNATLAKIELPAG
jgi:hypothetical protein